MNDWESFGGTSEADSTTARTDLFSDVTTHPETGTTTATYDHTGELLSVALPELVARREQCHPCSLPPLYDAVDAEALDELLGTDGRPAPTLSVSFRYTGYEVTVERDSLSVTPVQ